MFDKRVSLIAAVVLVSLGSLGAATATRAADQNGADAACVKATIDKTNALMKRNGSLKEFMDVFYEDDLLITGEGEKVFYRGLKSFEKPLAGYLANQTNVTLTVLDPVRSSGNMAVAFIHEHEEPAKAGESPDDYRILYVFRKGPKGCRVTMELFTSGTF
jgi:ketosteroid isomerase-like protein